MTCQNMTCQNMTYQSDKTKPKMTKREYKMECDSGYYVANSFWALGWLILKHRLWHWSRGDGWID